MIGAAFTVLMQFIKKYFYKIGEWVLSIVGKEMAFRLAMLGAASAALTTLYIGVDALLGGLIQAFPSGSMFQGFLYMLIPTNLPACLTAYASAWVCIKAYQWFLLSAEIYK